MPGDAGSEGVIGEGSPRSAKATRNAPPHLSATSLKLLAELSKPESALLLQRKEERVFDLSERVLTGEREEELDGFERGGMELEIEKRGRGGGIGRLERRA